MPLESDGERTEIPRIAGAIAIVCASLILSAGIFYWHFRQEIAAGNVPNEHRYYEGSIKDGEFWYRVHRASGNPLAPTMTTRLVRLNLDSGVETDTEFTFSEDYALPMWVGDTLFVYTPNFIYQVQGGTLTRLAPVPFSRCISVPFLDGGHMTVVYELRNSQGWGSYEHVRLAHWIDGKWVDVRRILMPGMLRLWDDDPQRGRKVLHPQTSALTRNVSTTGTIYFFPYELLVEQNQQQMNLLLTSSSGGFAGFRNGFEFAEENSETASALAPENAPTEVSGWEPVDLSRAEDDWVQMACDRDGLLFASSGTNDTIARIVRRNADGSSVELTGYASHKADEFVPWIAVDREENRACLIHSNPIWGSATVCRIDGNQIQSPHLVVPGFKADYVARWQRISLRVLSLWLLPMAVVFWGANWFVNRSALLPFLQTGQHITLASLWKRTLALLLDGTILLVSSWFLWRLALWQLQLDWPSNHKQDLANTLMDLEWAIRSGNFIQVRQVLIHTELSWLVLPFEFGSPFFGILVACVFPACIAMVYLEGRFGCTPGKWLAGIRVVRTTLRPCGFARVLVRKVLYVIDVPFLLTPIPAAVSIILSNQAQRIGDRVADTIVIDFKRPEHQFPRNRFTRSMDRTQMRAVHDPQSTTLKRVLSVLACLLIVKVTFSVMSNYPDYFPPNFQSNFLRGRELYFSGNYHQAFYAHIVSGPVTLILGTILVSERFRRTFPAWHRYLGRIQVICVLFLVTPSGLYMACYAETGTIAALGFAMLAIATGLSVLLGWKNAVKRQFADHRRWMWRCFLLLCSAVVLRLIAGLATVSSVEADWVYPFSAWASWLVPLAVFEISELFRQQDTRLLAGDIVKSDAGLKPGRTVN